MEERPAKRQRNERAVDLLPLEILLHIAKFATPKTLMNMSETCTALQDRLKWKIPDQVHRYERLVAERGLRNFYAQLDECGMPWLAPIIASMPEVYIAGGFVTRAIAGGKWPFSDIDIWVPYTVDKKALHSLIQSALIFYGRGFTHSKDEPNTTYFWADCRKIEAYYFPHPEMPKLQIIHTGNAFTSICGFDFSFCSCYFDGHEINVTHRTEMSEIVRRRGTALSPKIRDFDDKTLIPSMFKVLYRHTLDRTQKYVQRGFEITAVDNKVI
jgi:hypothetical protein